MTTNKSVFVMVFSMHCGHCLQFIGKDRVLSSQNSYIHSAVKYNSEFIRRALTLDEKNGEQYLTGISVVFKTMSVRSPDDIVEFTTFNIVGKTTVLSTVHKLINDKYYIERIFDDYNPGKNIFRREIGRKAEYDRSLAETVSKINWAKMIKAFPSFLLVDYKEWRRGLKEQGVNPKVINLYMHTIDDGKNTLVLNEPIEHKNIFRGIKSFVELEDDEEEEQL